jgi:tetratricopeptide (TPR) repeat protein
MLEDTALEAIRLYSTGNPGEPHCTAYDQVLAAAAQAVAAGSASAAMFNTVWHVRYLRGDYPGALQDLAQALSLQPNMRNAHYHRGLVLQRQGRFARAIEAFNTAAELAALADDDDLVDAIDHHLAQLDTEH